MNSDALLIEKYTNWLKEIKQREDELIVEFKHLTNQKKEITGWIKRIKGGNNMQIKLLELTLCNFKGLKDFKLTCNGNDIEIHGDNGSGKTTVFDAFQWLLFDKDSEGKKDFEIKTLDINNNPLHKLEHEVMAILDIDATITSLKKVYKEDWVKKRGTIDPELKGHTTEYWIDDVPTKKKDYDAYINNLIDETTFKLLTDIRYFTEKIAWKERRNILTTLADDHMDPVKMPSSLAQLIGNKPIEDFKKMIAEKKKKLVDTKKTIPVRIDEVYRGQPVIDNIDFENIKKQIDIEETKMAELNNQGKQATEHNNRLFDLKSQLRQKEMLKRELEEQLSTNTNKEYEQALKDKIVVPNDLDKEKKLLTLHITSLEEDKKSYDFLHERVLYLREKWERINVKQFEINIEGTCPTCNQKLPMEQIEKLVEDAKTKFIENKNLDLETINANGKSIANMLEEAKLSIHTTKQKMENIERNIQESNDKLNDIEIILSQDRQVANFSDSKEWTSLEQEINELNMQILSFKEMTMSDLAVKKSEIRENIIRLQSTLSKQAQYNLAQIRIQELEDEEKSLAKSIDDLEKQEFEIQEYVSRKINALENTVNGMFKRVKFKMFKVNLNGGVEEKCDILINGVPYSSANYAGRINAGLDIIRTLSQEYNTQVPVFVDNSESITKLMQLDQQMIKLIVDSNYKELAIIEETYKEAIAV